MALLPLPCNGSAAYLSLPRSRYRFGRTLGAGTYGIVREAEGPNGRVAIKIILKKNVKGNEMMVMDELDMLQRLKHPHIVKFVDWFESRVCSKHALIREASLDWTEDSCVSRTNITSSPSLPRAASCSTEFVNRAGSRRRMRPRP